MVALETASDSKKSQSDIVTSTAPERHTKDSVFDTKKPSPKTQKRDRDGGFIPDRNPHEGEGRS